MAVQDAEEELSMQFIIVISRSLATVARSCWQVNKDTDQANLA